MAENPKPRYKLRVPKTTPTKRKYEISLSLPGMISLTGVGVLALTFFFVMGILIGRGYRPETDMPPLEGIMPGAEHGQTMAEADPPKVLTLEELDYQDRLKASPQQMLDTPAEPAEPAPAPKPAPKPEPAKPVAEPAKPAPATFTPTPAQPGEAVYDYVYQVASFRKADMAKALSDKLAAAGLNARVESGEAKGSTWHRVQVLYHGTPASTAEMKAVLSRFGIGKPLLKKKTAAN